MMHLHIPHTIHPFVLVSHGSLHTIHSLFLVSHDSLHTIHSLFLVSHDSLHTIHSLFLVSHDSLHSAIAQLQAHRHAWAVRRWMEYHSSVCCGRSHPSLVPNRWLGSVCPQGQTRCLVSLVCSRWFVLTLALGHHVYFCSNLMHVHDFAICPFVLDTILFSCVCALLVLLIATFTLPVLFARFLCFVLSALPGVTRATKLHFIEHAFTPPAISSTSRQASGAFERARRKRTRVIRGPLSSSP